MNDPKKVIDGLEMLRFFNQRAGRELWTDKPHDVQEQDISNADMIYASAIALLKKQEAILLENQHKPYGISTNPNSPWISRCPKCGKKVEGKQTRYCKYCGQAVKWDEFDRFHHKNRFCAEGKTE